MTSDPEVGTARLRNGRKVFTQHGVYIGEQTQLKGCGALVMHDGGDDVTAQFDAVTTGLAYGWWPFKAAEFRLDSVVDEQ